MSRRFLLYVLCTTLLSGSLCRAAAPAGEKAATRIVTESTSPRRYAAVTPATAPRRTAIAVVPIAIRSSSQPPLKVRASTSRPRSSPPSRPLLPPGEANGLVVKAKGDALMNGPQKAIRITTRARQAPIMPRRVRTAALSIRNARPRLATRACTDSVDERPPLEISDIG